MVNKVILVGNLGKDPEVRFTDSGTALCKFPMATTEKWTDSNGQKQEKTEWHNIIVWGKQGETCGKYLSKGRQAYIEGSLRTRDYEDKSGVKKYITEVIAKDVRFLSDGGGKGQNGGGNQGRNAGNSGSRDPGGSGGGSDAGVFDDDVPF